MEQPKNSKPKLAARTKNVSFSGTSEEPVSTQHKFHNISQQQERRESVPIAFTEAHRKFDQKNFSPPLLHAMSSPSLEVHQLPKTYVSVASYTSQAKECLSFAMGDKCVLIQQSTDGWWLVNIGGQDGWVPGEYWKEDCVSLTTTMHVSIILV